MHPCDVCAKMIEITHTGVLSADTLKPHICRPPNPTDRQRLLAAIAELSEAVTEFLEVADESVTDSSLSEYVQCEINRYIYRMARLRRDLSDLRRVVE